MKKFAQWALLILIGGILAISLVWKFISTIAPPDIDITDWWEYTSTFVDMHTSYTFWVVVFTLLAAGALKLKGWGSTVAWIGVLLVLAYGFNEFINYYGEKTDRIVNHGDWSDPAGTTDRIVGGTVTVAYRGVRSVLASGTIELKNGSTSQCMHVEPSMEHRIQSTRRGYRVWTRDGKLLYEIIWSSDRYKAKLMIRDGIVLKLNIIGIPIGEPRCRFA